MPDFTVTEGDRKSTPSSEERLAHARLFLKRISQPLTDLILNARRGQEDDAGRARRINTASVAEAVMNIVRPKDSQKNGPKQAA